MTELTGRLEAAASEIADRGWTILPEFLTQERAAALRADAERLLAEERFRDAGVGRAGEQAVRQSVRSDRICWLDPEATTPAQAAYWKAMEAIRAALNRTLFLSLVSLEAHFAVYPPGAFYARHVDRFKSADERMISSTLYLNADWADSDGGQLRLFAEDESATDVVPTAGLLVLFRSDTVPHEVLLSHRTRYSIAGWFRRRSLLPF